MPFPDPAFESRMEYVRWVIVSALIGNDREGRSVGSVSGCTTGVFVRALLREDGSFAGSLRDVERQVRSERSSHRIEVRAALATLLLDGLVKPATERHADLWHLSDKSRDRVRGNRVGELWGLTAEEKARKVTAMKSSV